VPGLTACDAVGESPGGLAMSSKRLGSARRVAVVIAITGLATAGSLVLSAGTAGATTTITYDKEHGHNVLFTVPPDVWSITFDVIGASGADVGNARGGEGGEVRATACLSPGDTIAIGVGGRGLGINGGAGAGNGGGAGEPAGNGGGGGAGSGIGGPHGFVPDGWNIVAGGGGGAGYSGGDGGAGGGAEGEAGHQAGPEDGAGGTAGTPAAYGMGGAAGAGGGSAGGRAFGDTAGSGGAGSAGGGGGGGSGWFNGGGGGGANVGSGGGGAGGSGVVSGALFDVTTTLGGRVGDGLVTLTFTPGEPCTNAPTTSTGHLIPTMRTSPPTTNASTPTTSAPTSTPTIADPPVLGAARRELPRTE
jgi:hypothetical protein